MNIIVCGAGRVGYTISKQLSAQGHSLTVIDQSSELIQKVNDTLDVKGVVGRASFPSVLDKAGASETDMIIAVTKNDETNMVVCQIAHSIFNISKKIARIRSQEFLGSKWNKLYSKANLPIDVIIMPELEVAKALKRKLEAPGALDNVPFADDRIKVLEIAIDEKCPIVNTELQKLTKTYSTLNANVLGVVRNGKFVILKKQDQILIGDKAYLVVKSDQLDKLLQIFGHEETKASKILIIGGGNIGFNLAKDLEETVEGIRIKIIEKNKERAELIASELNNSIVINGDGLDEEILKEANLDEIETVLCLTNDDEDNIMASVLAERSSPNKRTIALVTKQNYSLLQSSLNIDDLVDPRMMTVSTILKHVHKGTIQTVYTLLDGEYEFIEAEILEDSELINTSIKDSNLPKEVRIGAVVRKKEVIIPNSKFKFEKKDLVVFLCKRDQLSVVENLFRISSF